ncbi:MAG: Nif3-like dinuclear metal center hexameric protein [Candidatus Ozemobacteraceae bacterium]
MASRSEILAFLEETFKTSMTADVSYNGLQFPGREEVTRVVTGVDASTGFLMRAVASRADLAIVHHGLFWKGAEWRRIDRFGREQMRLLIEGELNLYGLHLPLDMHPEYGNNALLARSIGAEPEEPFSEFQGSKIGFIARFPKSVTPKALIARIEKVVGPVVCHLPFGPERISRIGVVSGGGWSGVTDPAANEGRIDALLTGEVIHQAYSLARDRNIHVFGAGHYATETFGVQAIGELLEEKFGVKHTFIDLPTGL